MFYLIVLLSALSWRLANAGSDMCMLVDLKIEERESETEVVVALTDVCRPVASFNGEQQSLVLDFAGAVVEKKLAEKGFASRDLRLGYVVGSSGQPENARVRLYIRAGCLASIRYKDSDVIIRLAENTAMSTQASVEQGFLLSPDEEKYAPVIISLSDVPLLPVIEELAAVSELEIELSGSLPERFSIEIQADNPLEALKKIARNCDLELVRRGQILQISARDLAKPRVYAYSGDLLQ